MKRIVVKMVPVFALLAAAACNTVEGAGQDLSVAGQTIQSEARQVQ